jgi:hypothetical protein
MTISGYSNAIVDAMLGWLKGIANWVLRLFNLAGSSGGNPLLWLSDNWLKLLIFFLALGIILDRLIWLIRWRPYWVWFRKERVIVNDDRFFINADIDRADDWEGDLASNWDEHDYVVASTVVKRQEARRSENRPSGTKKRTASKGKAPAPRRRTEGTKVKRHVSDPERATAEKADAQNMENGVRGQEERAHRPENIFATQLKKRDVSDSYEDEVFNVSNLPVFDEFNRQEQTQRKPRRRRR